MDQDQPGQPPENGKPQEPAGGTPSAPWTPPPAPPGYGVGGWGRQPYVPMMPPPRRSPLRSGILLLIVLALLGALGFGLAVTLIATGRSGGGLASMSLGKKVGVVQIEGMIIDPREVVENIRRYRDDSSIAAVVVRIDSPGGVVGAAQEMYSELNDLAAEKPLVASMGSVAASGGYYVACPADAIYANPGTITGSIGVIMEFANLQDLLEWMKIDMNVIKSGKFKDVGSSYRPMSAEERQYLQSFVDDVHRQFMEVVAENRELPLEEVKAVADGRIFTGEQAMKLGLVDELGTMHDAVMAAARLAKIEGEPNVVWPKRRESLLDALMEGALPGASELNRMLSTPVRAMYLLKIN